MTFSSINIHSSKERAVTCAGMLLASAENLRGSVAMVTDVELRGNFRLYSVSFGRQISVNVRTGGKFSLETFFTGISLSPVPAGVHFVLHCVGVL